VVLNADGAVAGYTICNDMSSRSIEGENPLYLPQAKTYAGSCAVGPWIVPAWELPDPYGLTIELTIARDGGVAWEGSASTAGLHRKIDELAAWLFREDEFPAGVILSTGTSLVPELPFTLQAGDVIRVSISDRGFRQRFLGTLRQRDRPQRNDQECKQGSTNYIREPGASHNLPSMRPVSECPTAPSNYKRE